jgi:hypothetical protein
MFTAPLKINELLSLEMPGGWLVRGEKDDCA